MVRRLPHGSLYVMNSRIALGARRQRGADVAALRVDRLRRGRSTLCCSGPGCRVGDRPRARVVVGYRPAPRRLTEAADFGRWTTLPTPVPEYSGYFAPHQQPAPVPFLPRTPSSEKPANLRHEATHRSDDRETCCAQSSDARSQRSLLGQRSARGTHARSSHPRTRRAGLLRSRGPGGFPRGGFEAGIGGPWPRELAAGATPPQCPRGERRASPPASCRA